ncbi:thioredoxin-like protein [Atractiella rhizophila]|nr:thioredoxin-like protein [Atractiella rhizophila]
MVASPIRLHYFKIQGPAEPIRLLLADSGVEHDDIRIQSMDNFKSDYKTKRTITPFGKVPVLEYGDLVIPESGAILRFLGAELGYPSNNLETALSEGLMTTLDDVNDAYRKARDGEEGALKKWFEEDLPQKLDMYEAWTEKWNKSGEGYFFGTEKPTFAEFGFLELFYWYTSIYSSVLDKHPKLKAVYTKLLNREGIQKYLNEGRRPETRGGPVVSKIL